MTPRPASTAEIAVRATDASSFAYELADFLHEFVRRGKPEMLIEPPPLLRERFPLGAVDDAYLAAVAVSLSARLDVPAPTWTRDPERILREPWFASPSRHMRALLLVESPSAFRERNLFVSANALCVA
jgi:hypothetical protein